MNFDAFISYATSSPLLWIMLTIASYKIGVFIYNKSNKHSLLQPIVLAYIIIIPMILITNISYEEYFKSVSIINFFLGPATVALALPLYKNLKFIRLYFIPIVITLIVGSIFAIVIAVGILWIFDASSITMLAMTTKSVTAPITIITAKDIGAIPPLAIGFVVLTGLLGVLFGDIVFKIMKIKHDESKGFALGLISHAIGTAKAAEISEKATAFSALAMGLAGVFVSVLLPIVLSIIF